MHQEPNTFITTKGINDLGVPSVYPNGIIKYISDTRVRINAFFFDF